MCHLHQGEIGNRDPKVQPIEEPDTPRKWINSKKPNRVVYRKYQEPYLQKATPKRALIALNSHPPKYLTEKVEYYIGWFF